MKKILPLIILFVFSFSAIHAEYIPWIMEADGTKWYLSDDGTLTISGTSMTDYEDLWDIPWYYNLDDIKKVVITDGVTNIGDCAFYRCRNLTSVEIPNSVTSIGVQAFSGCDALTTISIPGSVTSIGEFAFAWCEKLTYIKIPNSVTSIGKYAFLDCLALTSITVEKGNTKYDSRDNCNAIIETNTNKLIFGCKNTIIPSSVTSIGESAFQDCTGLTSITIPNSVTNIGQEAFYYCDGLISITFKGSTPPEFEEGVFANVNKSISICVPSISIEAYKNALGGFGMSNIQAIPPISLDDKTAYTQDSQIDGVDVSYTRFFLYTNWESLYLPFSLKYEDWKDDVEVARINAVRQYDTDDDGKIDRTVFEFVKMKDGSVIHPNTPYIIRTTTRGNKTLSVKNTTVYKAEENSIECSTTSERFIFTGTYEKIPMGQMRSKGYYVLGLLMLDNNVTSDLKPYHWYMKRENRNSVYGINNNNTAKEISIRVVGEETTGVADIQLSSPNTQTYDLNGRRVNENNLKPGMYVKNGRKVIIR